METTDIKEVLQTLPTYLRDFFPSKISEEVSLVYLNKSKENKKIVGNNLRLEDTQTNSTLDVTGSPLEVDLKGGVTLILVKDEIGQHWTEDENTHFPMSISKARQYLNSKENMKNKPVTFIVCDGNNPLKTVILGCQENTKQLFTCTINVLGLFSISDLSISTMEQSHYRLSRSKDCKINYLSTFKYLIYGTFLHSMKTDSKFHGSIFIQMSTPSKCDFRKPGLINEMKLMLQIIAGHKNSLVYNLWKDLILLQSYTCIAYKILRAETEISNQPLAEGDIYDSIQEIITKAFKREPSVEFSLKNIRADTIMDKLWNILKCCENLQVLKKAFNFFFEELAEFNSNYQKIPLASNCDLATIANGIIDGKLAVPSINHGNALEFLFELGAEKMKNDYQTIIKQFTPSTEAITEKWNKLQTKLEVGGISRKTRFTQNLRGEKVNTDSLKTRLNYITKLHILTEFIYLVKSQFFLPEESFRYFCSNIYKNFENDFIKFNCENLQETPLCEFNMNIPILNINTCDIVRGKLPDFSSVQMRSVNGTLEAETIFVLSKYSIIPPTIYSDFNIGDLEEMQYYTYKLNSHIETI